MDGKQAQIVKKLEAMKKKVEAGEYGNGDEFDQARFNYDLEMKVQAQTD